MKYLTCSLSVVIISRNEERNIVRCIESTLKATEDIENREIILVDSASTDRTVEIAKRYPIRILQLKHKSHFSPAAGRFIGSLYSKGNYIQFLDGDMVLANNWLKNAVHVLDNDERVAGVVGIVTQEPYNTYYARKMCKWMESLNIGEIKCFDGANLCKRSVLEEIGFINPYLKGHEETELGLRITKKGYKILRLPYQIIHHLGGNEKFLAFFIKKLRNNVGLGQMLRCLLNDKELSKWFLEEHKFFMAYILYYILGLILIIVYPLFKLTTLIYVWVIGLLILLLINIIKEQNIKNSIIYMFTAIPRGIYFTIGFLRPVKDPDNFPKDVIVIK